MRAELTKYGPKHDYRGAHVTLTYAGRDFLGQISDVYYNETTGAILCKVRHLCGDPWPFDPTLRSLEILERTYEPMA